MAPMTANSLLRNTISLQDKTSHILETSVEREREREERVPSIDIFSGFAAVLLLVAEEDTGEGWNGNRK